MTETLAPSSSPARADAPVVVIVGAGVAGLACGLRLAAAGLAPVLLDKGRGIGGRLATRRLPDGLAFDHGAQFFTARGPDLAALLAEPPVRAHVAAWTPHGKPAGRDEAWLVGTPTMAAPFKAAATAAGLDIRTGVTVTGLARSGGRWRLAATGAEGEAAAVPSSADMIVLTAPAPQSARLAEAEPALAAHIGQASLAPCWAVMATCEGAGDPAIEALRPDASPLAWLARNGSKPGRDPAKTAFVAHARPDWSAEHLERDPEEIVARLVPEILRHAGLDDRTPTRAWAHRWRFAQVERALGEPMLASADGTLLAAGDWCLGARIEAAFDSGHAAAGRILARLGV